MIPTFAQEAAAFGLEMANEIDAFHAVELGGEAKRLSDDGGSGEVFLRQRAIGLEHETDGLAQVLARFLKRGALGVRTRELFYKGDKAFGDFTIDGGELDGHGEPRMSGTRNLRANPGIRRAAADVGRPGRAQCGGAEGRLRALARRLRRCETVWVMPNA